MSSPPHNPGFDHSNNIYSRVQVIAFVHSHVLKSTSHNPRYSITKRGVGG